MHIYIYLYISQPLNYWYIYTHIYMHIYTYIYTNSLELTVQAGLLLITPIHSRAVFKVCIKVNSATSPRCFLLLPICVPHLSWH